MQTKCESYSIVGSTKDRLNRSGEWLPIYHCHGLRWNFQTKWSELKRWE